MGLAVFVRGELESFSLRSQRSHSWLSVSLRNWKMMRSARSLSVMTLEFQFLEFLAEQRQQQHFTLVIDAGDGIGAMLFDDLLLILVAPAEFRRAQPF